MNKLKSKIWNEFKTVVEIKFINAKNDLKNGFYWCCVLNYDDDIVANFYKKEISELEVEVRNFLMSKEY